MFDILQIGLLIVLTYVCVYGVINRICKCIENCSMSKAFQEQCKTNKKKD